MGCSSSAPVVATEKPVVQKEEPLKSEPRDWTVRPGYSSGASSIEDEDIPDKSLHSDVLALLKKEMMADGDLTQNVVRIEAPFGRPIEDIYSGVHDGPVLGSGVSGIVRLVVHQATGVKYAVKCLDIGMIGSAEGLRALRNEISIMCQLDHPNIVRIEEVYESTTEIYIVQELCVGGDLFDRLDEQEDYHYTEVDCARLVKQMTSSVRYLHSKGIIHRDLKLENFLFSSEQPGGELKMIDFGLSKHFSLGECHEEKVGTPYTVAPEIIRGSYDEKSDIWAIGVITYLLLSGETPFGGLDGESLISIKERILRAQVLFEPKEIWDKVSDEAKSFVKRTLQANPMTRPTAKDAQKDPWLQVWAKKDAKDATKLSSKTVSSLMAFKEQSDMQKILSEVLSFTLLPEQIVDLRSEFEKMDTDGDGEITLESLKTILLENAEAGALGALSEEEVEAVFDSIRLRKSEPTIRYHEFLAAGLSLAHVDDRNLRLAFDRMDSDHKGFITIDDLKVLLGGSTDVEGLEKIWSESVQWNRITYDGFKRLMKGQPQDHKGHHQSKMFMSEDSIVLPAVQEGHPSPSPSDLDRLVGLFDLSKSDVYRKKRSRSLEGELTNQALVDSFNASLTLNYMGGSAHAPSAHDSHGSMSTIAANRALYRKHREMRLGVLEASKQFDKKRHQIQSNGNGMSRATLIMQRGAKAPVELEDMHSRKLYEAAARRCGRTRRTRNKTVSDVTGMVLGH